MVVTIKQSNFQTQQNVKIDIDKVYSDFIQKIDSIRSYVNVASVTKNFYKALKSKGSSGQDNKIEAQQTKQESRCHAFYRLLGLPIVSKDHKFYNPGYDIIKKPGRTITLETKINIATNQDPDFELISLFRELLPLQNLNVFSKNTSIDAAVRSIALLSFSEGNELSQGVINFRSFVAALDDGISDPFKTKFKNYSLGHTFNVGKNFVKFSELRDVNNIQAAQVTSAHVIKPFIVDPRIDFTAESKISAPFVIEKAFAKTDAGVYAQSPILELIINERFAAANPDNAATQGTFATDLKTFVEQNEFIKDESLVAGVLSGQQGLQQAKLLEFLKIAQAMISQLSESIKPIQEAQGKYYWLPVPSTIGPEGNCSVRKNVVADGLPITLFTEADQAIIVLLAKAVKEQKNAEAAKLDGKVHNNNFTLGDNPIFNPTATRGVVETATTSLQKLLKTRNDVLSKANTALRTIEIIMGEFSGLGLADIIALIYSFYLLELPDLLGFLDDDAYDRFVTLQLGFSIARTGDIVKSMTELNKTVKSLYEIMDKMYINSFNTHSSKT